MPKCSFCSGPMPEGAGRMFVKKSGQLLYFCSSKCQKNQKIGRKGKKRKWTETARIEKEKMIKHTAIQKAKETPEEEPAKQSEEKIEVPVAKPETDSKAKAGK